MVFEMHYTMIDDWKKIKPDIKTIYILPKNIEIPKKKARERNLSKEKEIERIERQPIASLDKIKQIMNNIICLLMILTFKISLIISYITIMMKNQNNSF